MDQIGLEITKMATNTRLAQIGSENQVSRFRLGLAIENFWLAAHSMAVLSSFFGLMHGLQLWID